MLRIFDARSFAIGPLCLLFAALFTAGSVAHSNDSAVSATSEQIGKGTRPNIIFILVDDLGYGDVGAFFQNELAKQGNRNRPWHRTPALDRIASEGMRLPHHYCPAPVCAPSRASLLLGVHQGHANVRDNQFDKELENNHTLATVLKTAGYRTMAIGKYGLQGGQEKDEVTPPDSPAHPLRRGFDEYFGYIRHRDGHEHYPKEGIHRGAKEVWEDFKDVSAGLDRCYTTDLFTARAKHRIIAHTQANPEQPFFMYLAYDTPHAVLSIPTVAYPSGSGLKGGLQWTGTPGRMINTAEGTPDTYYHPEYANATWDHDNDASTPEVAWPDVQKRYATVVRRIDDGIADLLDLLRDLKIDENTIIVFTTDNGPSVESYLEEAYEPTFFQGYGPYTGIKRDVLDGGVHVGALIRWPKVVKGGSTSDTHPTAFWDWMPTFAEAAGVAVPARTDGVSLLPLLSGNAKAQPSSTIYSEYFQNGKTPRFDDFAPNHRNRKRNQMQMLREGPYVGVRYDIQNAATPFEIYDITKDPKQSTDLAASLPEIQAQLLAKALRVRRPNTSASRPYDDALIPALSSSEIGNRTLQNGVHWQCSAGNFPWVPNLMTVEPQVAKSPSDAFATAIASTANKTSVNDKNLQELAIQISGWVDVPESGTYQIRLDLPGKCLLRIHDATVIDGDLGTNAEDSMSGVIHLAKGLHPYRLHCVATPESFKAKALSWEWTSPSGTTSSIPENAFQLLSK